MTADSDGSGEYPAVPRDRLREGGWKLRSETEETVFRVPGASVIGYTVFYEDAELGEALGGIEFPARPEEGDRLVGTGESSPWRFFFATRLSFRPPLAPGIGPAALRSTVAKQAKRSFTEDLGARGFEGIESGRTQRVRTGSGDRARLRKFTAELPLEGAELPLEGVEGCAALGVEGWLAVWVTDGSFRIAGGAYPGPGLSELLGSVSSEAAPSVDPERFREELLELIRAVR